MMKHTLLALATTCLFSNSLSAQHGIATVIPDVKGNVFLYRDSAKVSTIFKIADGQALGSYAYDDPELPAKALRYQLQTPHLGRQRWESKREPGPTYITEFIENGQVAAKIAMGTGDYSSWDRANGTPLIAVFNCSRTGNEKGVYTIDTREASGDKLPERKLIAKYPAKVYYGLPRISYKGKWIFDQKESVFTEVATGKIVRVEAGTFGDFNTDDIGEGTILFSTDETMLMYGTDVEVIIVDVATGKKVGSLPVPKGLLQEAKKGLTDKYSYNYAVPLSDGKSLVYVGFSLHGRNRAWLVKGDDVTEISR